MLQLTKRTEYGLIALTHLAGREGEVTSVREIAEHYSVPRRLLAEVLKDLCRTGHVISQRGANGGYSLSRPANSVTLGEVVDALEGRPSITGCETMGAYKNDGCDVAPRCPIRSPMQRIRSGIWNMMQRTTLSDLANPGFNFDPSNFETRSFEPKANEQNGVDSNDHNSDYPSRIPFSA